MWVMMFLMGMLLLASCDTLAPQTPTATLRGAVVPTRIPTETPTATYTPSRTPTFTVTPITPTATATPIITNTMTVRATTTDAVILTPSRIPPLTPTSRSLFTSVSPTVQLILTSLATLPATELPSIQAIVTLPATLIEIEDVNNFAYSGTIDRRNVEFAFVFVGEQGTVINIQMIAESGDLDPYLLLLDESGEILIENDDDPQGSGRDAFIGDFVVPVTGNYMIIASRFRREQGSTTGDFTLMVSQAEASAEVTEQPTAIEGVPNIGADTIVEGTIDDDNPTAEFTIEVAAAATIEIELTALSGNLDAYLLVLDAAGTVLIENDDDPQGSGRDAYIREFQLPAAGQYTIVATRFRQVQGSTSGDFRLRYAILDE